MSDGIHALVFSKDRAMQLDAFLRSAKQYAPHQTISVLTPNMDASYLQCRDEHLDVFWWFEGAANSFQYSVDSFVRSVPRCVFHTDDDVWFRKPGDMQINGQPTVCSYRLGRNTNYCHPLARTQQVQPTILPWRWKDADGDFAYPLSLNGTVYHSSDLLPLLDFPFANPTELEAGLAARVDRFEPQWMTSSLHSSVVSLPHNVTSSSSGNPRGANPDWQPDALCAKYLEGWRIDLERMDFSNVTAAHQEVPLEFTRA